MKLPKILLFSCVLIFFAGCEKQESMLKGNLVGFVTLIDETGNPVEDKSGVTVSIEGLSISAKTNETGRFAFIGIPSGTYNLVYDKAGFGMYKQFSYQFMGGNVSDLMYSVTLYEQPNIAIQSLDLIYQDNIITVSGTIPETSEYRLQIFINDSSNVSNLNFDYASPRYGFCCIPTTRFSQYIYLSETPFSTGDKVYLIIYFYNPNDQYGYYDYENETNMITSCKKGSGVINLKLE